MRKRHLRPLSLFVAGTFTMTSCGQCGATPQAAPTPATSAPAIVAGLTPPPDAASPASDVAVTPDLIHRRMVEAARRLRPEWYSPEARAAMLAPGIEAAFLWVRDHVGYDAYSGALRDAEGTLVAGAGNSLDRSLLLARLLDAKGVETRLVAGQLPRELAEAVFGRMFRGAAPQAAAEVDKASALTSGFFSRAASRARRDHAAILAALGPDYSVGAPAAREQAIADIMRHAWVQAHVDGRWVDLDAAFPDAHPGEVYGQARQTAETPPLEWYQTVTIRIVTEHVEDGVLTSKVALEVTHPAVDLVQQRVFLLHVPAGGGKAMGLGLGAAASGDTWTPILVVDDETETGRPIDFGDSETGTGFDALGGSGSRSLVAEWIEFEVARPDGRRDVTRRAVVDRASAAWRAGPRDATGLRPLARGAEGVLAPAAIHHLMFSAGPRDLRRYGSALAGSLFRAPDAPANGALSEELAPLAERNAALLLWTDDVIIPGLDSHPDLRVYADAPRIAVASLSAAPDGHVAMIYDLRRDWVCAIARDAASDRLVGDRKLWFTALEGALEHESAARDAAAAGLDPAVVRSTSALLASDGAIALRSADLPRLSAIVDDPESRARLETLVRGGSVAVVPRAALASRTAGWWEVAPNGDAVAVLDGLNVGGFNSGFGAKPLPPATPPVQNIGPQMSPEDIAKEIQKILDADKPDKPPKKPTPRKPPKPARPVATPRKGGNEYGTLITVMGSVAIVAGTIYALKWHRDRMAAAAAEFDAWSAAEDAKQQRALRAARRQ